MNVEIWRTFDDGTYEVSDLGRVRRAVAVRGGRVGHVLTPRFGGWRGQYLVVHLRTSRRVGPAVVHRLVAEAFIGPTSEGQEVNHCNGIKTDNRAANLEYVTSSGNQAHAYAMGLKRAWNSRKTSCLRGHPFDETNTRIDIIDGRPNRACRACSREKMRRRRAQKRTAA